MAKSAKTKATLREFQDALAEAVSGLPRVTLINGGEHYLRRDALGQLTESLRTHHPQVEIITYHGPASASEPGLALGTVVGELSSSSLFASEKAIILRQADRVLFPAKAADGEEETGASSARGRKQPDASEMLIEYLDNPSDSVWLLLECESVRKQFRLGKALCAKAYVIECPTLSRQNEVDAWLRVEAGRLGKKIAPGVSEILFTAHGGNLGALHSELEKLSIYLGEREEISRQDVETFLSGSMELDVFGLTNALESRNLSDGLLFARRICLQGTRDQSGKKSDGASSAHRAMFMVSRTLENLFVARAVKGGAGEVAAAAGTSPWRAEKLLESAEKFSVAELRHALAVMAEESRASHDTGADVSLSLEKVVIAACRKR